MTQPIAKAGCFVHGVTLDGDGSCTPVNDAGISEKPVWLHLDYSHEDCAETLRRVGVANNVIDTLVRTTTRPRTIPEKQGFVIYLRAINLNPGDEPDDMVSLRFWLEKNRLITVRQRKVYSIQDIHSRLKEGAGPQTIQELFLQIVERLADRISDYVDDIDAKIGSLEDSVDAADFNREKAEVSSLRRHVAVVRRYLAPQRDALESFHRLGRDNLNEAQLFELQEQTDRIVRYVEDLDLIRERCMVLQEELMNRMAQEQNARMYVLSIVAAIFLPISFVTGVFGMNVAGLPGLETPSAFAFVALSMGAIVVGIISIFKLKRWF